mmetsp:Transcript_20731/g.57546  ORF Transcript_20731/g.57546 Transcript_20731/m.57546 type:complete len:202 (-) Transcript_20731:1253-1858(-)
MRLPSLVEATPQMSACFSPEILRKLPAARSHTRACLFWSTATRRWPSAETAIPFMVPLAEAANSRRMAPLEGSYTVTLPAPPLGSTTVEKGELMVMVPVEEGGTSPRSSAMHTPFSRSQRAWRPLLSTTTARSPAEVTEEATAPVDSVVSPLPSTGCPPKSTDIRPLFSPTRMRRRPLASTTMPCTPLPRLSSAGCRGVLR